MRQFFQQVSPGKPYFPEAMVANQAGDSSVMRHMWMCAAVFLIRNQSRSPRLLEVGSWAGNSTLTWAEAFARFDLNGTILCVDPWEPYLTATDLADVEKGYYLMDRATNLDLIYSLFRHNIGFVDPRIRVDHFRSRFATVAPYLKDGHFDIVYIDGSHYYEDVRADILHARRLVRDGGFVCGDDLEWQLDDVDAGFVQENIARDYLIDKEGRGMHPGVTLAVAEAFGRVVNLSGFWIMQRQGDRFVEIELNRAEVFIPGHLRGEDKQTIIEWIKKSGLAG